MLGIGEGRELEESEYKAIERAFVWMSFFGIFLIAYSLMFF